MDVINNPPGSAIAPCIPMNTCLRFFVVTPKAVGDGAPPHNHCPSHQFFLQGISCYCLMSSVGVGVPPHTSLTPQGRSSPIFASRWTFIYFVPPQLIPLSCKTLTPPVLLYTCLEFLEATTQGQSLLPRPTTSLVF